MTALAADLLNSLPDGVLIRKSPLSDSGTLHFQLRLDRANYAVISVRDDLRVMIYAMWMNADGTQLLGRTKYHDGPGVARTLPKPFLDMIRVRCR